MKNAESLKAKIREIAVKKHLNSMEVLQMYFFERFLDRLSHSEYKFNFVIKGGFLISSIIGVANRTTMDMDTTIKGIPLKKEIIKNILEKILNINVNDRVRFVINDIKHIREDDEYENFRIYLTAFFDKIKNPMKIDITTGDVITPKEITYNYSCVFEEKYIKVQAYPIETILAEKYETIIKRNITTTRMRDFYDIFSLYNLRKDEIDFEVLKSAIVRTANKRNSLNIMDSSIEIIKDMQKDNYLVKLWNTYLQENEYIEKVKFENTLKVIEIIATKTIGKTKFSQDTLN
ncbi:nucleotidyl transferase AbiEii/AbiGii toxin family protein [Treponema pedis]|uniref:nucleotidyl transferase AbiEii/AbiGii toxin family protein n=1 Tax=Treponema pedis TaxID=409322 RepID=UPI00041EEC4F|nr:nucleotidyl transferase AbiEii/AbiGii toxin family protein [Treponema pedis]